MINLKTKLATVINTGNGFFQVVVLSKIKDVFSDVGTFGNVAEIILTLFKFYLRVCLVQEFWLFETFYTNLFSLLALAELCSAFLEVGIRSGRKYDGIEVGFKVSEHVDDIKFTIMLGVIEFFMIANGQASFDMNSISMLILYVGAKLVVLAVKVFMLEGIIHLALRIAYSKISIRLVAKFEGKIRAWIEDDSDSDNDLHGGMSDGIPIPIVISIVQSYTRNKEMPLLKQIMARFTPGLFLYLLFSIRWHNLPHARIKYGIAIETGIS